jgi:uncharacterized protein YjbI with pentapeptide repeats
METRKPILQKSSLKETKIENVDSLLEIENVIIKEGDFENLEIEEIRCNGVIAENILLASSKIEEASIIDTTFSKSNFAGTVFGKAFIERVEIDKSRVQGTQFMGAKFKDVVIKNSKCTSSSFRFSTMKNVVFVDCDVNGVDFQGTEMENVLFQNCDLKESCFLSTKLKNVILSTSNIEGIKINKEAFGKVSVNTSQALYLSSIFGLVIEG